MTAACEADDCESAESFYVREEDDFTAVKWLPCQEDV